jgi:hypothetical protein
MTPYALARHICARVQSVTGQAIAQILEPGAGTGNFVAAARAQWPDATITALDIDQRYGAACKKQGADAFHHTDYTKANPDPFFDLVIGNPPYNLAEKFVENAVGGGGWACFLMRAAFRSGVGRWKTGGILRCHPPLVSWPIVPRPSFTGKGTEHSEYEAFLWAPETVVYMRRVEPIMWKES